MGRSSRRNPGNPRSSRLRRTRSQSGQDEQQDEEEARQSDGEQPEPETGDTDAQPQPGQMSREEAERLLQAITEDPGEIRRQRRSADPGRRTRRPW